MADWGSIWKGVTTVAGAVGKIFGDSGSGTPGARPAPSLIGQKPNLNFARIGAGEGAGLMAGTGEIRIDVPSRYGSKNQWIDLQARYLTYLNMAEAFEEPGKVRRAVKLKVT